MSLNPTPKLMLSLSPEPCCFMPIMSPLRLKFLKFFQIRYLESQNVLSVPDRAYKAYWSKAVGPLFKLLESNSRDGVKLGKYALGST